MSSFWIIITMTFFNPNTDMLAENTLAIGNFNSQVECENARVSETQRLFHEHASDIWDDKGFFPVEVASECVQHQEV